MSWRAWERISGPGGKDEIRWLLGEMSAFNAGLPLVTWNWFRAGKKT